MQVVPIKVKAEQVGEAQSVAEVRALQATQALGVPGTKAYPVLQVQVVAPGVALSAALMLTKGMEGQ